MAMVAVTTKRTSCSVDLKQAGLAPYLSSIDEDCGELVVERWLTTFWWFSPSFDLLMMYKRAQRFRTRGGDAENEDESRSVEFVVLQIRHFQARRKAAARP
jgi:hypothetical protein